MIPFLQATAELPGGYGAALLQTLLALGGVCVLAWVVLRFGARRGFGMGARGTRVKVLERVQLDPRRSLYLVEVAGRGLLLSAGENGAPALLTELDLDSLPEPEPTKSFADVLRRQAKRGPEQPDGPSTTSDAGSSQEAGASNSHSDSRSSPSLGSTPAKP